MNLRIALMLLATVLAGCVDRAGGAVMGPDEAAGSAEPWQRVYDFEGQLTAAAATASNAFEVPDGAAQVEALLTWREPAAQLGFRLLDPAGQEAAAGWNEAPNRAYVTNTHPVTPGEWAIEVFADRAVTADYSATIKVTSDAPDHGPITTTFVIRPQNPARLLPPEARGAVPPWRRATMPR